MIIAPFLRFPGFLLRACTLSYDDGVREDEKLIEIMRKYGLKGTFNINSSNLSGASGRCLTADEIKSLVGEDTEIALHGFNHCSLAKITPSLALRDVIADRECLEKTFGRIVRGMAYANGSFDESVVEMLRMAGVAYSRTTVATEGFDLPTEWLLLNPTCHHNHPRLFELVEEFLAEPNTKYYWSQKPRLFYLWGHSYEFPRNNNWDVIEKFGEIMSKRDDVWFATNMEIYKYCQAAERLVFSLDLSMVENPTDTDVYLCVRKKNIIAKAGQMTVIN